MDKRPALGKGLSALIPDAPEPRVSPIEVDIDRLAPNELQSHRFFLQARERWREKFLYCTRLVFMPTEEDHSALSLPSLLSPMYYPLHAIRVFGKYGLASLKSFL